MVKPPPRRRYLPAQAIAPSRKARHERGSAISEQTTDCEEVPEELPRSRRNLLKLAGVAGAAGAAALVARPGVASAANGDTITVGNSFTGTAGTSIQTSDANDAAWIVQGTGSPSWGLAAAGTSGDVKCIGTGVLHLKAALTGNAQPTFGAPFQTVCISSTGVLWTGNENDSTNTWKRINAVRVDAASGNGNPFQPFRLIDTRKTSSPIAGGGTLNVAVAGAGTGASKIPANAIAIFANLTAVSASGKFPGSGFLTVYPKGTTRPLVSNVNMASSGSVFPNFFFCGLGSSDLTVYASIKSHILIDVFAYVQ